jgi:hypothetical protein
MEVKGKPDIIDIIEQKRLQRYGHVKRMPEERIPKLITDWIPWERRKRGRPRKTWMEGVKAAMTKKKFRNRSVEKQRGMAFGFRKTAVVIQHNVMREIRAAVVIQHKVTRQSKAAGVIQDNVTRQS